MGRKSRSKSGSKSKRQRKMRPAANFELSEAHIPDLMSWVTSGMLDTADAPAAWRTSPATDHRGQVCVLHLNETYARFVCPRDGDEFMFALAKTQHELGAHALTFHHGAVCSGWAGAMFTAQQPAIVAAVISRHWGDALRQRHALGDPFAHELRWSLPSPAAEMTALVGLSAISRADAELAGLAA